MRKKPTKIEIEDGKTKALKTVARRAEFLAHEAEKNAQMADDLLWAFTSEDMPLSSFATVGTRAGKSFFYWLRDYRKHIEGLSPARRAKLRKILLESTTEYLGFVMASQLGGGAPVARKARPLDVIDGWLLENHGKGWR